MKHTQELVNALGYVAKDYEFTAKEAVKSDNKVYFPANITREELNQLILFPQSITSSNSKSEPCYPSLDVANKGFNLDGSNHQGYLVIDPISKEVVDLVSRDGCSKLGTEEGLVKHLSSHEANFGMGLEADLRLLNTEQGKYLILETEEENRISIYADIRCRCPCLDADVFPSEESAAKKIVSLEDRNPKNFYDSEKIDNKFLIDWGLYRKGFDERIIERLSLHVREEAFKNKVDPISLVAKFNYRNP